MHEADELYQAIARINSIRMLIHKLPFYNFSVWEDAWQNGDETEMYSPAIDYHSYDPGPMPGLLKAIYPGSLVQSISPKIGIGWPEKWPNIKFKKKSKYCEVAVIDDMPLNQPILDTMRERSAYVFGIGYEDEPDWEELRPRALLRFQKSIIYATTETGKPFDSRVMYVYVWQGLI